MATIDAPTHGEAPWRQLGPRLAVRRLWPQSLRTRLVVIVVAIDCLAAALTGSVMIWKARLATQIEIASAMQLAKTLVADTIRLMQDTPPPVLLQSIDLHFQSVRHIKISVFDAQGHPVEAAVSQSVPGPSGQESPPQWFLRLTSPAIERADFPVRVHGTTIGTVAITTEPRDEIGEAWTYAHALLEAGLGLNIAVLAVLFLAFGRVLQPLTGLVAGLRDLEGRNYAVRLPQPSLAELATITNHFNRTAEALAAAHGANRQLNLKLLTAQDDERRRTALELHDEVGPCLFALDANANSIARLTKDDPKAALVHQRALDLAALVGKTQSINRRVLDRLRPMALGEIPLRESLVKLLCDFDRGDEGPKIELAIEPIRDSYGFLVDLTVYRCIQEGLFNAIRHADATHISVHVAEDPSGRAIQLRVVDNGRGLVASGRKGLGLAGMRERIEALAGTFEIGPSQPGTNLSIGIPLHGAAEELPDMPQEHRVSA